MTRMGDEMILALAASLETGINKSAAKKEKECKECECDPCECEKEEEKEDKEDKKEKKDKKDKKASAAYIVSSLYKLANELDDMGADEASSLVDDALRVIVKNMKSE